MNRLPAINRVVVAVGNYPPLRTLRVQPAALTLDRLNRLRRADAIVRRMCAEFDASVWQFPIILIPLGTQERPDSVVLRPVQSVDGMTANAVWMNPKQLDEVAAVLESVEGVAAVFYDVTNKPPATIEWE